MDRSEIIALWEEDQQEIAQRHREQEEVREITSILEQQKKERIALAYEQAAARRAELEQRRLIELPEIIAANKDFHMLQLATLKRVVLLVAPEKTGIAVGGSSINNDRIKDIVTTKTVPIGEITDGVVCEADFMLFQRQHSQGLGRFIISGKLWSIPKPRNFVVTLTGSGSGKYSEFARYNSVDELGESKRIVDASSEELGNLRWPDEVELYDIQKISEILDFIEGKSESTSTAPTV